MRDDDRYEMDFDLEAEPAGTGLLGQTLRNVAGLVFLGLLVAGGAMTFGDTTPGRRAEQPTEPASPAARQVAATPTAGPQAYEIAVESGSGGHFWLDAEVNGAPVRFIVDTGASAVVLTRADARRLGIFVNGQDFTARFQTANGEIAAAPVRLDRIRVGDLIVDDVDGAVVDAPLETSLLGMTFLDRLAGYEVEDGRLLLRW